MVVEGVDRRVIDAGVDKATGPAADCGVDHRGADLGLFGHEPRTDEEDAAASLHRALQDAWIAMSPIIASLAPASRTRPSFVASRISARTDAPRL